MGKKWHVCKRVKGGWGSKSQLFGSKATFLGFHTPSKKWSWLQAWILVTLLTRIFARLDSWILLEILLILLYTFFFFDFLFYLGVHSSVITCSPMKPRARMYYRTVWLKGWVFIAHMFRASHKQWKVAILLLINTSASTKFRIVEMDNWLDLNKRPCWDSIHDPFTSKANPLTMNRWTTLPRLLIYTFPLIKYGIYLKFYLGLLSTTEVV